MSTAVPLVNPSENGHATEETPENPRSVLSIWCERFAVSIVFTVFVVFRAADRAFLYRVQKYLQLPIYTLILSNLFWPIAIQLMTIAMLLGYIMLLRFQGETQYTWRFFLPGSEAASTLGAVPMYQLALFSIGDQINAAMSAPPSPYVALPMQSIMTNFVLVWMLGLAYVWLKTRFRQVHYIGCILIITSVVVGVSDKLQSDDCTHPGQTVTKEQADNCLTTFKTSSGTYKELSTDSMILWYGLFLLSTVPSAVSNCYKQRVLKGRDVDVCYATWWSGNFQVLWGILLFWINWIPLPDQPVQYPGDTFQAISETWQCFLGNVPNPQSESCAGEDGPALKWFVVYLCFNLTFNICLLWLTKRMSAVWAQIATTLCLDLTNIFSQFKFIVGDSAETMTVAEWLGTIIASVALWTYNVESEIRPATAGDANQAAREADGPVAAGQDPRIIVGSMVSDGHPPLLTWPYPSFKQSETSRSFTDGRSSSKSRYVADGRSESKSLTDGRPSSVGPTWFQEH